MTAEFSVMKNVLTPLAKSVLVPLVLTATASATGIPTQKKILDQSIFQIQFCEQQH